MKVDVNLAEQVDAFVSRFGRLQDTLGDKLLPALLRVVEEPVSTVIDNFDKAEKFGWIDSVDEWLLVRQLRNQMIHDYIEESSLLADALNAGHQNVDLLKNSAQKMIAEARRRLRDT